MNIVIPSPQGVAPGFVIEKINLVDTDMLKRLLLLMLLAFSTNTLALELDIQAAKDEGMRLWGISEWIEMQPYLEQSASAGDVESMYYLGEATRLLSRGLTREAMDWYLKAAEQGDPYAMLRLFQGGACTAGDECPDGYDDWHYAALDIVKPQAEAGDPDAMLALFHTYRMLDESSRAGEWLARAAEAGQPEAQTILGTQILDGRGWHWTNSRRLQAAEEWFIKAAENNYVPAMSWVADIYIREGRDQEAWEWMQIASEHGHIDRRFGVGWCYLDPARDSRCQNDRDATKGWAILYGLFEETSNTSAKHRLRRHREDLTAEEIEQAEALAKAEWIGREPPLSNFPPRFGY